MPAPTPDPIDDPLATLPLHPRAADPYRPVHRIDLGRLYAVILERDDAAEQDPTRYAVEFGVAGDGPPRFSRDELRLLSRLTNDALARICVRQHLTCGWERPRDSG